jgi:hypothetical protein
MSSIRLIGRTPCSGDRVAGLAVSSVALLVVPYVAGVSKCGHLLGQVGVTQLQLSAQVGESQGWVSVTVITGIEANPTVFKPSA